MTTALGDPRITFALALLAGIFAQSIARHTRLPGIVLLLLAGVLLGPDGLGWVQPRSLGEGLFGIVDFAVAIILFEGGLNLQISRLRRQGVAIRRLITYGALITLLGGAAAVHLWVGFELMESLLFGALVVVTGPTVVGPLISELRLKPRVATVLEAEGVLIDPIGAILAVVILDLTLSTDPGSFVLIEGSAGLARVVAGTVFGAAAGFLLASALRVSRLIPDGLQNVFVLSSVLLLYAGAELVLSQSGVLAVTIAGVVVGNMRTPVERDLREFKDQLTVMLIGLLFVTLAADVRYEQVEALGWAGLAVVATLVLVVRPFSVWLCTRNSDLLRGEQLFIAWVAPRGDERGRRAPGSGLLDDRTDGDPGGLDGGPGRKPARCSNAKSRHGGDSRCTDPGPRPRRGASSRRCARRLPGFEPRRNSSRGGGGLHCHLR